MSSFSCLFVPVCLITTLNNPVSIAVLICALEQRFWMLGEGRRRQAFCSNDGCWNVRTRWREMRWEQLFFSPTLLILSFSVSLLRLPHSVWIIDTKLLQFDFISQFPQQLKAKGGDHSPTPHPHPSAAHTLLDFLPSTVSVQTLS